MERSKKKRPAEIRFSPLSLLCLLFCWVGVSGLIFYAGILVGRMEQMREIRSVYGADERVVAEEDLPNLSFEEDLVVEEPEFEHALQASEPETRPSQSGSGEAAKEEASGMHVLQIASFRKPEHAENLVRELRAKGYRCFQRLPGASSSGDAYCRVFVGPLPDSETAMQMKERLEEEEGYKGILIRSFERREAAF